MQDNLLEKDAELTEEQKEIKRQREIQAHNEQVDYEKMYKQHEQKDSLITIRKSFLDEVIVQWSRESLFFRLPCSLHSDIASVVVGFLNDNVHTLPLSKVYKDMVVDYMELSNYLTHSLDSLFLKAIRDSVESTDMKSSQDIFDGIGLRTCLCFISGSIFSKFLSNPYFQENFHPVANKEDVVKGQVGMMKSTAFFTDAFFLQKVLKKGETVVVPVNVPGYPTTYSSEEAFDIRVEATFDENFEGENIWEALKFNLRSVKNADRCTVFKGEENEQAVT